MAPLLLDNALLLIEPRNQCNHKTIVVVYIDRSVACKQLHLYNHSAALVSDNTKSCLITATENLIIIGQMIKIEQNLAED